MNSRMACLLALAFTVQLTFLFYMWPHVWRRRVDGGGGGDSANRIRQTAGEIRVQFKEAHQIDKRSHIAQVSSQTSSNQGGFARIPNRTNAFPADDGLSVLLVVKTGPHYFKRRQITRDLWLTRCTQSRWVGGEKTLPPHQREVFKQVSIECLFVTGKSQNQRVMSQLQAEVREKHDIFVVPFLDSYDRMTTKTQWIMLWSLQRKKLSQYLMLVDDDTYVVFSNLVPWLLRQPRNKFYAGHLTYNCSIVLCKVHQRNPNCIDRDAAKDMFQGSHYPPFASGFSYIVSRDVAAQSALQVLAHASTVKLPGTIEDVTLGVLLKLAGIQPVDAPGFVHWLDEEQRCPAQDGTLVIGNAPPTVLARLGANERAGRSPCHGLG